MSHISPIYQEALENNFYRKVIFTGDKSQLVVMSINPGEEIGEEVHEHVEQTLFPLAGEGEAILNDNVRAITTGDVIVVTPGTKHNIKNTGDVPLKICTVYAPANHIDGRVHPTKADADADTEDEEFGHRVS